MTEGRTHKGESIGSVGLQPGTKKDMNILVEPKDAHFSADFKNVKSPKFKKCDLWPFGVSHKSTLEGGHATTRLFSTNHTITCAVNN